MNEKTILNKFKNNKFYTITNYDNLCKSNTLSSKK